MTAMLEKRNNKRYLHENEMNFPNEIILLFRSSNMAAEHTLYNDLHCEHCES